ncbi:MAG: winged helix-turn-helix domain-containing protein [Marinicella sp.]|nr:winged helix-turn-helix domain-containing protein [Xanthomonadales bacterium]
MLNFCGFQINPDRKELTFQGQSVELTKRIYDLLYFLVQHPHAIHSKDDLIEHVWHGRVVSTNTIDQTISKLRKTLAQYTDVELIESVYGQGVKWSGKDQPAQQHQATSSKNYSLYKIMLLVALFIVIASFTLNWQSDTKPQKVTQHILVQSNAPDNDWEVRSATNYLGQLLSFSNGAEVLDSTDRPRFVTAEDFTLGQQKLIPNLTVLIIKPVDESDSMAWLVELQMAGKTVLQEIIKGQNFSELITQSSELLFTQLKLEQPDQRSLVPQNDYVLTLYINGLKSYERLDWQGAIQHFDLVLKEQPDFHLARFKKAEALNQLGLSKESLSLLDTLLALETVDSLKVSAWVLKAHILSKQGRSKEAELIYQQLFSSGLQTSANVWNKAKYEFAMLLVDLNKPQMALATFDDVISELQSNEYSGLLAAVLASKASLLQKQGDVVLAVQEAHRAIKLFESTDDVIGLARTYSLMARIANQRSQYALAEDYLKTALQATDKVGFKLGSGATLNELVYTLMVQGQLNEAAQYNARVLSLGIELEYVAMQMSAYQSYFDIQRKQKLWDEAQESLDRYRALANSSRDTRRLAKADLMDLSLKLDQKHVSGIDTLITHVQTHIEESDEKLMLPSLQIYQARYYWLQGQPAEAVKTLQQAQILAEKLQEFEAFITANNYLALIYLEQQQPQQALNVLALSEPHQPFVVPYLRIKAEALIMQQKYMEAFDVMNLCKQTAADFWSIDEEQVWQSLNQKVN